MVTSKDAATMKVEGSVVKLIVDQRGTNTQVVYFLWFAASRSLA
jgi:hypothetical protein